MREYECLTLEEYLIRLSTACNVEAIDLLKDFQAGRLSIGDIFVGDLSEEVVYEDNK